MARTNEHQGNKMSRYDAVSLYNLHSLYNKPYFLRCSANNFTSFCILKSKQMTILIIQV